uniref:Si:ch211-194k22.8 n=1 Tax=Scleropages formosus TaxID=113540 RepID=A0A8C9QT48_SCLFO
MRTSVRARAGSPTATLLSFQESDYLQSRSKAELIAMVLCMQSEMESLKEQIRCLTGERQSSSSRTAGAARVRDIATLSIKIKRRCEMLFVWRGSRSHSCEASNNATLPCRSFPVRKESLTPRVPRVSPQFITPQLLERCNTGTTAQKLTNDLLRGLYERECLASHSISGIVYNKRGQPKPALPADEVQAILSTKQIQSQNTYDVSAQCPCCGSSCFS